MNHFLCKHRGPASRVEGIEEEALDVLCAAEWPGNVRELENVIESSMALAHGPLLRCADLPLARRGAAAVATASTDELPLSFDAYERAAMERALHVSGGDVVLAAQRLGIGRSTFYRKLARHGIGRR